MRLTWWSWTGRRARPGGSRGRRGVGGVLSCDLPPPGVGAWPVVYDRPARSRSDRVGAVRRGESRCLRRRVLPTPPPLRGAVVVVMSAPPTFPPPPEGEGEGLAHDCSPLRLKRVGRARGGRASPGALNVLPFRRDRSPRAAVFHAPSGWRPWLRALPDHRRRHCWLRRAADMTCVGGPHRKRAASRRTPSIDIRMVPPGLLPAGFIARPRPAAIEERGSDALPTDGMDGSLARVPAMMADDVAGSES